MSTTSCFASGAGTLPVDIVAVVGNHPTLKNHAEFYGKPFVHIPVTADTKPDAESALLDPCR